MATNHVFRTKAMLEYGEDNIGKLFNVKDMVAFLNTYRTKSGRIHRKTQTNAWQMGSLLSKNPNFIYHQKGQSKNGYWEYIVIPEPKTMEE
tara:strand:+ start:159 stop:431 length:273 start_codon:yes stop_codon:yes gene_type:complete